MHHQPSACDQVGVIGLEFACEGSHHEIVLDALEEQPVSPFIAPLNCLCPFEQQLCVPDMYTE